MDNAGDSYTTEYQSIILFIQFRRFIMKLKTLLLSFALGLFSMTAMAGSGHDHGHSHSPVNQVTAKKNATKIVASFVTKGKLDKSWASITASSVDKKIFKSNPEWVVLFVNNKITDIKKKKLYVFLTLGGEYIAANHTGN